MKSLKQFIPDAKTVINIATPDVGAAILATLVTITPMEAGILSRANYCNKAVVDYGSEDVSLNHELGIAVSSAWSWLEGQSLIAPNPKQAAGFYLLTKLGSSISSESEFQTLITDRELPDSFLHPLLKHVKPLYLMGRFDTAVFEAFRTLEVKIRERSGLGADKIGVNLAAAAFNPENGPLTNLANEKGERVALMSLMTGAFGYAKNPASHRDAGNGHTDARELILLASHLMKVVTIGRPGIRIHPPASSELPEAAL